jgi:hypothetical protein
LLNLEAAFEGSLRNALRARVDHAVATAGLFNLSVRHGRTGEIETHRNLSMDPDYTRCALKVLADESRPAPAAGADPFGLAFSSGVGVRASDGVPLPTNDFLRNIVRKSGPYALERADIFNLLCIPP